MEIVVPAHVVAMAATQDKSLGLVNYTEETTRAQDFVNPENALKRIRTLQRFTEIQGKRVLEIGSGFGISLALLDNCFGAEAWGIEPSGVGFGNSLRASHELLPANGISPYRAINAVGEHLPFPNESFDIVYSANVLEHTQEPENVLREAVRVLKPGGLLHFEIPNYLSYFEGHYMVPMPPIFFRWMLPFWVRYIFRRDEAFAKTLQPLNPLWCRRQVRQMNKGGRKVKLESLGEDLFLERLSKPFEFQMQQVRGQLSGAIRILQFLNVGNWIGRTIVALQGYYPIVMNLRKL